MTRQEQIKQQAKLLCNTVSPEEYFIMGAEWADAHPDIDVRTMAAWQSGYNEGIAKSNWISVEDELPPRFVLDPNDSLFVLTYGFRTIVAFYKYDKGEWVGNTEVTHWMPLPAPPESGSSEIPNNHKKKGGEE